MKPTPSPPLSGTHVLFHRMKCYSIPKSKIKATLIAKQNDFHCVLGQFTSVHLRALSGGGRNSSWTSDPDYSQVSCWAKCRENVN